MIRLWWDTAIAIVFFCVIKPLTFVVKGLERGLEKAEDWGAFE